MRCHCVKATAACLAAALLLAPLPSFAAKMAARSGEKSCREAINGLISLLDANSDNTALYRDTFGGGEHLRPRLASAQSQGPAA
jgi:hypothetical protein